ncbi:hypothetical protein MRX96_009122 [Rhipicephalus microplus]
MGRRYRRRRQGPPLLLCAPVARAAFSLGGGALSFVGVKRRKEPAPAERGIAAREEGRVFRVAKLYVGFLRKDSAGGGGLRRPRWGWFRENERAVSIGFFGLLRDWSTSSSVSLRCVC